jgi:hypothetical protein
MAQATQPKTGGSLFATDGRSHPLQDGLTALTVAVGLLAFVTCWFHNLHMLSTWAGIVGVLVGAYGMYVSVTTRERFLLILGLGASGVGLFLGMAHGGPVS